MASAREDAKKAIVARDNEDPELQAALSSAHRFQLELAKETHRHTEVMRGFFGRMLGPNDSAPTMVAFVGMMFGIIVAIACLVAAAEGDGGGYMEFWERWAERAFGFSISCVAFIFGNGLKN